MASWNSDGREPLLDGNLQMLLQKRGRELLGVALLGLAALVALMLGSYSPQDPSWMASTDLPVQNSLGRLGAAIAAPLMIIIGVASWGLALFGAGWGLRLIAGRGHDMALSRAVFLPIALAVTAVWAATLLPSAGWDKLHGMGGIFGDTVLAAVVNALPMSPSAGVTFMGFVMAVASLAIWGFVLGVERTELRQFARFVVAGVILSYAGLIALMSSGLSGGTRGLRLAGGAMARGLAEKRADYMAARAARADARAYAEEPPLYYEDAYGDGYGDGDGHGAPAPARTAPSRMAPAPAIAPRMAAPARRGTPVIRAAAYDPQHEDVSHDDDALFYAEEDTYPTPPPQSAPVYAARPAPAPVQPPQQAGAGLLAKLKALSGRPAEPVLPDLRNELVEPPLSAAAQRVQPVGEARIKSRIADVIRDRKAQKPVFRLDRTRGPVAEPPLRAPVAPPVQAAVPQAPAPLRATLSHAHVDLGPMPDWMMAPPAVHFAPQPEPQPQPQLQPQAQPPRRAHPDYPAPQPVAEADLTETYFIPDEADLTEPPAPRGPHVLQRRVVATAPKRPALSRQAQAETEPVFEFEPAPAPVFELPPLGLLESPSQVQRFTLSDEALEENARMLENVLDDYGVRGEIVSVRPGPVVTQYELEPAPGLKASRVIGLADDIARSMSALSARVSTVPGRSIIGIELPNAHREKVVLREILSARDYGDSNMRLPLALGKAIDGEPIVANLAKMPHLLIAGTTGSGKSVAINTMILSLLYRLPPEECRMIMIDPKMLELSVYDGIPHLLSPVVTDPKKAVVALKWVVGEMEERYRKMSKMGVRNIEGYNGRVREALERGEMFKRTIQTGFDDETGDPVFETDEFAPELLPFIVVVVDEMADLMMVAGKEIEACIQRLAQMARASGIHLIMATQRPSVDVITGTIKANFPTRISFQVTSKIDSRTILGEQGAEQL
ncbi:MAG: cell division protein FtsK, partial [Rhodobacteraceae bacterium]